MQTIDSLTTNLAKLFEDIHSDRVDLKKAGELNNTAGKLLKAYQVQLAYHALREETPTIPFLAAAIVEPKKPKALPGAEVG